MRSIMPKLGELPVIRMSLSLLPQGCILISSMLLIMFLMYTTAHHTIRKQCFEAFWYTHHLVPPFPSLSTSEAKTQAFFFMIALYTHATGCFVRDSVDPDYIPTFPFYSTEHCLGYLSWRFIIWAGILYFGERMYRIIRSRRQTEIIKVLLHPSGAMEVRFKKDSMKYKAGQWLFLNCPEVSRYQWHPVSPHIFIRRWFEGDTDDSSLYPQHLKIHSSRFIFVKLVISPKPSVKD